MINWNYMFISIVLLIVALIIIGTSALGILLSRKNKALKNYTSKVPTIIFVVLLSIIAFSMEATKTNFAGAIGYTLGYVYFWSLANYLKYEEGENTDVKSVIAFNRVDCDDMGYQIILMSLYGDYMGRGETLTHFIDPDTEEEKRFYEKTSIAYRRHEKLCN